jgi:hypothetical protein
MKTVEFLIPTWTLPYLINDDPSGLSDEDQQMVDDWVASKLTVYPALVATIPDDSDNHYFAAYNDMSRLGDDVINVTFITQF